MSYDPDLERRVDAIMTAKGWGLMKVKMFGSMAYKSGDKLWFTINGNGILLRAGGEMAQRLEKLDGAEPAVMGRRSMKNWWQVSAKIIANDAALYKLLEQSKAYVESLPG
jgi:hypothetical protein